MRGKAHKRSIQEKFFLIFKGIAMGAANKVPGVSGGIVALVGGFYEELIYSFQHLNLKAIRFLVNGRFKSFWDYINGTFLCLLFGGVIISYFSVSLLLDIALKGNEPVVIGAFLGMIVASLYLVIKQINTLNQSTMLFLLMGLSAGLSLSFVKPITENDQLLFVFFCGMISVSGMTIPGLSGSFLLLILGNYNLLLVDAVNALFKVLSEGLFLDIQSMNDQTYKLLIIVGVFTLGSLFGLVVFSNMIKWVLEKYPQITLATIIGFIAGTLRLVWPWKSKVFLYDSEGVILKNSVGNPQLANYNYLLPDFSKLNTYAVLWAIILGIALLLVLDYYDKKRKKKSVRTHRKKH
ncbi:MAG: DUF368 domain-containing protein [Flavobacteriaceae bacterium]